MEYYKSSELLRKGIEKRRKQGHSIGFVPTMGFFHEGHRALFRRAREEADCLVVSLFVNPAQFAPNEDLASYPRDLDHDRQTCLEEQVDILFHPEAEQMYLPDHSVYVVEQKLSHGLCGTSRPSHFSGVCTVCAKLFNIVQPDLVVMGEKDYQQLQIIKRMVRDLDFPLRVIGEPIVREPDGLAMSSRNKYLSAEERSQALCLYRALKTAQAAYRNGERCVPALKDAMRTIIAGCPSARLDYLEFIEPETLAPQETATEKSRAALAVYLGNTRLIDNAAMRSS